MRPTSLKFNAALRITHLIATRCELYFPGSSSPVEVPIEAGSVTDDRTAQIRRTGQVQIPWSLKIGETLGLDLRTLPLGGYASVYRGIKFADGTTELLSLGHLRVESVTWRTSDDSANLELADRMAQVKDEPFLAPWAPAAQPPVNRAGTLTNGSAVVTGLALTSDLVAGMTVSGPGIVAGTRIQSIDSSSQITLNQPASTSQVIACAASATSPILFNIPDTRVLFTGMTVSGQYITPGSIVVSIDTPNQVTLDRNNSTGTVPDAIATTATFTLPASQTLSFGGAVRVADAAIQVAQDVFGTQISYQKLFDPTVALVDVYYTGSRADAISALAGGGEAYFDANGNFIYGPPAGETPAVWTIDAGQTGVMIGADESLNRTSVYNGVLVTGQNAATDAPVASLVVDNTPGSATLWGGPFGKVALIQDSQAVQTTDQATAAAQALLNRQLSLNRSLTVTAAPNPALEAGDVVQVVFPDGREETHVIDSISNGLAAADAQGLALQSGLEPNLRAPFRYGVYAGAAAWKQLEVTA